MPADLEERLLALKNAAELDDCGMPVREDLDDQRPILKSEAELNRWFDAALTAPSLEAFRTAVQNGKGKRKKSK
jgi:hypothetical protein